VDELLCLGQEEVASLPVCVCVCVCVCVSYVVDHQVHDGLGDQVPDGPLDD